MIYYAYMTRVFNKYPYTIAHRSDVWSFCQLRNPDTLYWHCEFGPARIIIKDNVGIISAEWWLFDDCFTLGQWMTLSSGGDRYKVNAALKFGGY